jgi:hypothetical protein
VHCEPGYFCPSTGEVTPTPCPGGTYSSGTLSTVCTDCALAKYSTGLANTACECLELLTRLFARAEAQPLPASDAKRFSERPQQVCQSRCDVCQSRSTASANLTPSTVNHN